MSRRAQTLVATLIAVGALGPIPIAQALGYHVVAESQVPESRSQFAGVHANIAQPRAIAVRLWARRNGKNLRGQVVARVTCGHHWQRLTYLRGATPFLKQVPFKRGAGLCVVDASAMEVNQNSHAYLHLVLLAR